VNSLKNKVEEEVTKMELRFQTGISLFPLYKLRGHSEETGLAHVLMLGEQRTLSGNTINGYRSMTLPSSYGESVSPLLKFPSDALAIAPKHPMVPSPIAFGMAVSIILMFWGIVSSMLTLTVAGGGLLVTGITALWEINAR
jgi:hypothetical protein